MKKKGILIFSLIMVVLIVGIFIYMYMSRPPRRKDYVSLNLLKGENSHVVFKGYASDGDDQTTGKPEEFRPPGHMVSEGGSRSEGGEGSDYARVKGKVVAQKGPQADNAAFAFLSVEATSSLSVSNTMECRYLFESTLEAILDKGAGNYLIYVKIFDSDENLVPKSEYNLQFYLTKDLKGKINIVSDGGKKVIKLPPGKFINRIDVSSGSFTLVPGEYAISFEVKLNAQAEKMAEISTVTDLDLISLKKRKR